MTSRLGLFSLVCLVVANMIGVGLYSTSGYALRDLGSASRVLMVWLIGGMLALCGAVAYGAIARRVPGSGGEYHYLTQLGHPSLGFLAGWISIVAGFTGPIAAMGKVFGTYVTGLETTASAWPNIIASVAIALSGCVHIVGLTFGAWLQNVAVAMKVGLLIAMIVFAMLVSPTGGWSSGQLLPATELTDTSWLTLLLLMLSSLVWISLSYSGYNAAIYIAGESDAAATNVPRAMLLGTIIVTCIYLAMNAIFLYAAPADTIAGQERVASIAAQSLGGPILDFWIRIAIALSTATSLLSMLMTGPRVYARMAEDGVLPSIFGSADNVPRMAIAIQAVACIAVVWISQLETLLGYLGLTLIACSALTIACLGRMRVKFPSAIPVQWWEHVSAAIYVLVSLVLIGVASRFRPYEFYTCLATIVVGFCLYFGWRAFSIKAA